MTAYQTSGEFNRLRRLSDPTLNSSSFDRGRNIPLHAESQSTRQDYRFVPGGRRPTAIHRPQAESQGPPGAENGDNGQRRRVPVACGRCRKRKIRCSGDPGDGTGCENCRTAGVNVIDCRFQRVGSYDAPFANQISFPLAHHPGGFSSSPNLGCTMIPTLNSPTLVCNAYIPQTIAGSVHRTDFGKLTYSCAGSFAQPTSSQDVAAGQICPYGPPSSFATPVEAISGNMYNGSVYGLGDSRTRQGAVDTRIPSETRLSDPDFQPSAPISANERSQLATNQSIASFGTSSLCSSLPRPSDRHLPPPTRPERRDSVIAGTADHVMRTRFASTPGLPGDPSTNARYSRSSFGSDLPLPILAQADVRYPPRAAVDWNVYQSTNQNDQSFKTTAGDMGPPSSNIISSLPDTGILGYISINDAPDQSSSGSFSYDTNASLSSLVVSQSSSFPHGMPLPMSSRRSHGPSDTANAYTLSSAASTSRSSLNESSIGDEHVLTEGQQCTPLAHPQPQRASKWNSVRRRINADRGSPKASAAPISAAL